MVRKKYIQYREQCCYIETKSTCHILLKSEGSQEPDNEQLVIETSKIILCKT